MKKIYPKIKIAILTRPDRFDLYGQYADFLVPLKIGNDSVKNQIGFKLKGFKISEYNKLSSQFRHMYNKRFKIVDHYYPDITDYRYKIRWQFSRSKMNYDFKSRHKNVEIIKNTLSKKPFILITAPYNTNFMKTLLSCIIKNKLNKKYLFLTCGECGSIFKNIDILHNKDTSKIGYLIEIIKRSRLVIGPKSDLIHLSLLLKCPVISWGSTMKIDMINPLKTRVIIYNTTPCKSIEDQLIQELGKKKHGMDYNCF